MYMKTIGVIAGSLRRDSYSKAIARAAARMMPEEFRMEMIDIGSLPMFHQDYDDDGTVPEAYTLFRRKIAGLDGFLFVTPEYNRSVPPVLKNALDVASRPYGQNLWDGKPGAVISVSPGKLGAFGANHHLRQTMTFLNVYMMQQPEAYIGNVDAVLDADGNLKDERTEMFLHQIADAFARWVHRLDNEKKNG